QRPRPQGCRARLDRPNAQGHYLGKPRGRKSRADAISRRPAALAAAGAERADSIPLSQMAFISCVFPARLRRRRIWPFVAAAAIPSGREKAFAHVPGLFYCRQSLPRLFNPRKAKFLAPAGGAAASSLTSDTAFRNPGLFRTGRFV